MTKRFLTSKGLYALIDDEDFERVNRYRWHAKTVGNGRYYIEAKIGGKNVYLHRFLLNAPRGTEVDHVNHNTLDNRRSNLRLCSHRENVWNTGPKISNSSGRVGVHWDEKHGFFAAQIRLNGKKVFLGYFKTVAIASRAYKRAERIRGQFIPHRWKAKHPVLPPAREAEPTNVNSLFQ